MSGQPLVSSLAIPVEDRPSDRVAALFDAHHQRLYRLARRLTPSPDDALDLVQETFLRAARAPTSVPVGADREEAWLVRVPRRRVAVSVAAAVAAAIIVVGLLVGFGDRATLQAAVRFEVRLAETQPVPGLIVARLANSGDVIYLHPEMLVTNDDIAQSWVLEDGPDRFGVSVEFLQAGAQRMRQATAAHLGRPVAILIDGDVVAVPTVRSAISNAAVISGNFTRAEAERIAEGINMR
jgi:hypothetical protein